MDTRSYWVFLAAVFAAYPAGGQPALICGGGVQLVAPADLNYPLVGQVPVSVFPPGAANVSFQMIGQTPAKPGGPTFMVVSPSSGTTPAVVYVALDPNIVPYLPAGGYGDSLGFGTGQASSSSTGCGIQVTLTLTFPGPPSITSVLSSATFQPVVSPGELVSIFGVKLGTPPVYGQYGQTGLYPTTLGNTTVTFNGVLAPLLYVSGNQINAVVPYEVAGQTSASVVVSRFTSLQPGGYPSPPFSVPVVDTSPGVFTATQTGTGQGAIVNYPDTYNSASDPAPKGSVITLFATGAGLWNQNIQDGSISLAPAKAAAPVSLTIGGQPAQILYAGAEPFQVSGMLQVNAIVPSGIGSGTQPVVLFIGQNNNAQQQVTLAVQ